MPILTLENAGKLTKEQKDQLIEEMTDIVAKLTGKPKNYVYVMIKEIDRENFGIGGKALK
ncbi:MAG: hypothetical protein CSB55_00450 [Candidatus Cloacimonadota bacterium]|nr:MAG: hypothetical protein CSB55_00450 [Candidatus Cloacimonadota bacterium]